MYRSLDYTVPNQVKHGPVSSESHKSPEFAIEPDHYIPEAMDQGVSENINIPEDPTPDGNVLNAAENVQKNSTSIEVKPVVSFTLK